MPKVFQLDILTPEHPFFSGQAEVVIFNALDGFYQVLAGHEPTITALSAGPLRYKDQGEWYEAVASTGFVEIMPGYVTILASAVERPEEIDVNRAEAARERAEERLRQHRSKQEYISSQAALARALARLKVGRSRH